MQQFLTLVFGIKRAQSWQQIFKKKTDTNGYKNGTSFCFRFLAFPTPDKTHMGPFFTFRVMRSRDMYVVAEQ